MTVAAGMGRTSVTPQPRNLNLTLLGTSGSGKTSFLAGLHSSLYRKSLFGFSIAPCGERKIGLLDEFQAATDFDSVSFEANGMSFPPNTSVSKHWNFDLRHSSSQDRLPICSLAVLDYRGGVLNPLASEKDANWLNQADVLLTHVSCSEAVIVLADSIAITKFPNVTEARRRAGLDTVMRTLRLVGEESHQRKIVLLFALTKVDALDSEWSKNNYEKLFEEAKGPLEELSTYARRRQWKCGIIPVSSVGSGNADTTVKMPTTLSEPYETTVTLIKDPEPQNIGEALLYCINSTLELFRVKDEAAIKAQREEAERLLERSSLARQLWALITKQPSPASIAAAIFEQRDAAIKELRRYEPYLAVMSQSTTSIHRCDSGQR